MTGVETLLGTIGFVTALGGIEAWRHRRNLARMPLRIHVNGTRGKSSVTRLIAAGLRQAGIVTVAKTTGTLPRVIFPDGSEQPVDRPLRANVIEQVHMARIAADQGAEALVVECMALQPWLQWISEAKLVRATHGVITNARADHLDVMGPDEESVAWALANMTPRGGKLFTAEEKHLAVLKQTAQDRRTKLIHVSSHAVEAVSQDDMAGFSHVEHAENVALALRVCRDVSVDRETALRGMWRAAPDPGAMTIHEIEFFGRRIVFVNAFAANDPQSTERAWRSALGRHGHAERRIALINCRADRPERSWQLGQACADWPAADHYLLVGSGKHAFLRAALIAGVDERTLLPVDARNVEEIFEFIVDVSGGSAVVVGMGNIGELGLDIVRYFRNRAVIEPAVLGRAPERAPAVSTGPSRLGNSYEPEFTDKTVAVSSNGRASHASNGRTNKGRSEG